MPVPLHADLKSFICPSVAIRGARVWGIDNATESTRLIRLDLDQNPVAGQEISLPEGLDPQDYTFHCILSTGSDELLAVLANQKQVDFYRLENFEWQKITSLEKGQDSGLYIGDVTIDSLGQIWILRSYWIKGKPVGQYDPKENTWTWYDIQKQPDLADRLLDYAHIAVDDLGRIWLSAEQYKLASETNSINSHDHETSAVGVFEKVPGNKLVEVRHYTTANSSLETSRVARIIIGPDEKVWSWESQLVWMDSRQQELPQPFAKWFVTLTSHKFLLGLNAFASVCMVLAMVTQLRVLHLKRAKRL